MCELNSPIVRKCVHVLYTSNKVMSELSFPRGVSLLSINSNLVLFYSNDSKLFVI